MNVTTLHARRTHPEPVEGCFACKVATIQISPAAMPAHTEGTQYGFHKRFDRENEVDRAAYRRLRMEGHQPPHIAGCAELEATASTSFEIARGKAFKTSEDKKLLKEALSIANDAGMDPVKPAATPWTRD